MPFTNQEIADYLKQINTLMLLSGENPFRASAFDRAAQAIETLNEDINTYIENESLTQLKGVGKSIAEDIYKLAATGTIPVLQELQQKVPQGLIQWLDIPGLGPKKIYKIHNELGITELEELKQKCRDGSIASLSGMGQKSADKIVRSIEWMEQFAERCHLHEAWKIAQPMLEYMSGQPGVEEIELAGSLRRSMETIGDIDILVGAGEDYAADLAKAFVSHELVQEVLGEGTSKSSIRTKEGRQVDLRIVLPGQFPAALMYFTGSKDHNVVMRQRARDRSLSLNEYGLFRQNADGNTDFEAPLPYQSEADIFGHLGLNFIPPELREDRGEFEYFQEHEEMPLVTDQDIKGVVHAHSTYSDGKYSIRQMAEACMERGYSYLGISDHSQTAAYAGGLKPDEIQRQWREIEELNEEFASDGRAFKIFKGIESDILSDGSLDYDDEVLAGFDFVIASVHNGLEMEKQRMMERFEKAITNPFTTIVGHPTGRLLLKREGSQLDLAPLIELAAEHDTAIEINANPLRLDLDWRHGNKARETGLLSSINPDAHTLEGIDHISYGVKIARKGKFDPGRILNARSAGELDQWFRERKEKYGIA